MTTPEAWAKESFEIAVKIAYQNGALHGAPKGNEEAARGVTDAAAVPNEYARMRGKIADRRMILSAYRFADLLQQISANLVP